MSTSSARHLKLRAARKLPAATCPACDVVLERVANVSIHLRRCDERLADEEKKIDRALGIQ